MLKLRKLIKEHTWDREFGDPLVTFEDVMKKHQKNKFKEDLDSVDKEDDDVDNDGDSDASDDYLKNRRDVISKAIEKESVTEGWWDSMSDKAKAAYIKTHGEAPNVAGDDDDDYDMGPDMDSRDYDMDDDDDKYDKYGQEMGGTPSKPRLNQETLMIDSKQYRRINESVKQKPKPKYEFSEFYQRFKRQE